MWLKTDASRPVFTSDGTTYNESSFSMVETDMAGLVDGQPSVRIEFMQNANSSTQYAGWNIELHIVAKRQVLAPVLRRTGFGAGQQCLRSDRGYGLLGGAVLLGKRQ